LGRKHILVAGGIGITPFIAMMEQLDATGQRFELHYGMRDHASGAYAANLVRRYGDRVHLYRSRSGERVPVGGLLEHQPLGTHLYVCGPKRMIDSVLEAGQLAGWPDENLHAERFESAPPGEPFDIGLARSGGIVHGGSRPVAQLFVPGRCLRAMRNRHRPLRWRHRAPRPLPHPRGTGVGSQRHDLHVAFQGPRTRP
jgi:ferredoxin-NADP reductase